MILMRVAGVSNPGGSHGMSPSANLGLDPVAKSKQYKSRYSYF